MKICSQVRYDRLTGGGRSLDPLYFGAREPLKFNQKDSRDI